VICFTLNQQKPIRIAKDYFAMAVNELRD
jgi:hypothetical protein